MTWRRLGNLIRHLPPESATMTALRNANPDQVGHGDPAEGCWSQAEMLQAATVDAVHHLAWLIAAKDAPKGRRPKKPKPIPRPGVTKAKPKKQLSGEAYERLYAHINGLPGGPQLQLIKGGKSSRGRDNGRG